MRVKVKCVLHLHAAQQSFAARSSACQHPNAGEWKWPRCTLAYAPPDIVRAAQANCDVQIGAAQDVWALGVMAYEAIVGAVTFTSVEDIGACAAGVSQYPWERPSEGQPGTWRRSRLRALVAPCLARDPAARPTAAALLEEVSRIGHATTMQG